MRMRTNESTNCSSSQPRASDANVEDELDLREGQPPG
jgi:hypothetical protein